MHILVGLLMFPRKVLSSLQVSTFERMNVFAWGCLLYIQDTLSQAERPEGMVDFFLGVNGKKSEIFKGFLLYTQWDWNISILFRATEVACGALHKCLLRLV